MYAQSSSVGMRGKATLIFFCLDRLWDKSLDIHAFLHIFNIDNAKLVNVSLRKK